MIYPTDTQAVLYNVSSTTMWTSGTSLERWPLSWRQDQTASTWDARESPEERRRRRRLVRRAAAHAAGVPPCDLELAVLEPPDEILEHQVDAITRALERRHPRARRPLRSRPGARL